MTEHELWGCALKVEKDHGESATLFIAERIGELAVEGDLDGIATWKLIADRYDRLQRGEWA